MRDKLDLLVTDAEELLLKHLLVVLLEEEVLRFLEVLLKVNHCLAHQSLLLMLGVSMAA